MSSYKISIRYAKSLISLAVENNKLEEVKRDIDQFNKLCEESRPLKLFLRNPVIPNHRKTAILRKIFAQGFDLITMNFFDIVTRKNRENYLIEIAALFIDMYREYKGIIIARLQSSIKFSEAAREKLIGIIKENVGLEKTVEIREQINKDLIGGFILTIGDKQVDDSVQNKLKFFRQKLIVK